MRKLTTVVALLLAFISFGIAMATGEELADRSVSTFHALSKMSPGEGASLTPLMDRELAQIQGGLKIDIGIVQKGNLTITVKPDDIVSGVFQGNTMDISCPTCTPDQFATFNGIFQGKTLNLDRVRFSGIRQFTH